MEYMMLKRRDMLAHIPDTMMDRCKIVARRRTNENLARKYFRDVKKSSESQETIELRGIVCEASLALTLDLDVEQVFRTGVRSAVRGSDLGDLIYDNSYIDVKGVRYPHSNLLVSMTKKNTMIDVFVLVHESDWGNRFLGAIPFHKAFGQKIVLQDGTDLGNGVWQADLLDLDVAIQQAKAERERIKSLRPRLL